jgi:hypothetical protein
MFQATRNVAVKYGAKLAAVPAAALVLIGTAHAQEAESAASQITAKVTQAMSSGEAIALAIVLGLFAIFAIKMLWRAK